MAIIVGKIYNENCHYCQELEPAWNEFAEKVRGTGGTHEIQNFNTGIDNDEKIHSMGLTYQGVPTIYKKEINGTISYMGGEARTVENLMNFAGISKGGRGGCVGGKKQYKRKTRKGRGGKGGKGGKKGAKRVGRKTRRTKK